MKFITLVRPVIFFVLFYLCLMSGRSNHDVLQEIPLVISSTMQAEETFQGQTRARKAIAFVRFIPQPRSLQVHNQPSDLEKQNKETVHPLKVMHVDSI